MQDLKNLNCLLPKTKEVLLQIVESCNFLDNYVFVGGSALALHICHRKSEDLDFFTYREGVFDKQEIRKYIGRFDSRVILNESDEQIDLLIDGVKVTFFDAKWKFLEPSHIAVFNLATIESIAAMKVNVLFLRAKYRDYYDLYCLSKSISLRKIFECSRGVVEGLTYKLFCTSLLYIDDIVDDNIDHLEPQEKISKKQIQEFFEKRMK